MKHRKKVFHILLLAGVLLMLFSFCAAALTHYDLAETFEDDAVGENPSSSWYTYGEKGFDYANATDDGRGSSSNSFLITDDDGGNLSTDAVAFNFTSRDYSYFSFWFKWDNSSHNRSYGLIDSTAGYVINIDFGVDAEMIKVYNYTTNGIQRSLTNNTWYKLRFDFNYSTYHVRSRLFNGAGTTLNDSWLRCEAETGRYNFTDIISFNVYGSADDIVTLSFDDMELHYSVAYDNNYSGSTDNLLNNVIPILFAAGILTTLIGLIFTGNLNRETMILILIISIIGVVALQVITSI